MNIVANGRAPSALRAPWLVVACLLIAVAAMAIASAGPQPVTDDESGDVQKTLPVLPSSGRLDAIRVGTDAIEVIGWAMDGEQAAATVRISGDGRTLGFTSTGVSRPDVATTQGQGGANAGFVAQVAGDPMPASVCADVVGPFDTAIRIGCVATNDTAEPEPELAALIDALVGDAEAQIGGFEISIAVIPLDTGLLTGANTDHLYISASIAKTWWLAAALAAGEVDAAAPLAEPIFTVSENPPAGVAIDLAGGIDRANAFTSSWGLTDTAALRWNTDDIIRESTTAEPRLGESNYTTTADASHFMYVVATNQILPPELSDLLLTWMLDAPRETVPGPAPFDAMIPHALPPAVQDTVAHKAGWLEPFQFLAPTHLLDMGLVHPVDGRSYAIAMAAAGPHVSADFERTVRFFEHASCAIYVEIAADDDWTCPTW